MQSSMVRLPPPAILTPASEPPVGPSPFISSPFSVTKLPGLKLTVMPLVPATSTPPVPAWQDRVIDTVIVTAPKPPGSRQSISPAAAVLEIAPAQVLHGAVRLQGLASSPTPEIQVLVACADAVADPRHRIRAARTEKNAGDIAFIILSPHSRRNVTTRGNIS